MGPGQQNSVMLPFDSGLCLLVVVLRGSLWYGRGGFSREGEILAIQGDNRAALLNYAALLCGLPVDGEVGHQAEYQKSAAQYGGGFGEEIGRTPRPDHITGTGGHITGKTSGEAAALTALHQNNQNEEYADNCDEYN